VIADQRVTYARDALRYFDGGQWADAGGLTVQIAGHLADAVRQLLDVIAEGEAAAGQRRVFRVPLDIIGEDDDAGKLTGIRAVLAAFDWERDDRQYALERIEMIAGGDR